MRKIEKNSSDIASLRKDLSDLLARVERIESLVVMSAREYDDSIDSIEDAVLKLADSESGAGDLLSGKDL